MPEWLFDKKELKQAPSSRDGVDFETECRYRKEGARFISDVGADLNLKHDTVATGCVYFHRFFMFHSFRDFNRYVAALGCLFLAGKVEETPKKCRDIIRAARQRLNDEQFAAFGEDPREEVMTIERVLLQTIKFDLQVDHPYQYLLKYAKILKGDQEKIQKVVQMAWTFINDSFCTSLCLQWEPEVIAIALMYLASRLSKFEIQDWQGRNAAKANGKWWDQFVEDMSMDLLEDVCHQVLDLYSNNAGKEKPQPPSTPSTNQAHGSAPSSTSTPSPGGATGKTPNATAPSTPNPIAAVTGVSSVATTPVKTPGQTQPPIPAVVAPAAVPPTPLTVPSHAMSVPPPLPPSMAQPPSYAFPVGIQPPMQPLTGVPTMPPMPYPPAAPGQVYATYNYGVPPPTVAGSVPPPAYAIPAGYGPPPGHYDYRAGQPVTQPTYGTPASIPHAYNIPPPSSHLGMNRPPPGYGGLPPPPAHHRMPPHAPHRRIQ